MPDRFLTALANLGDPKTHARLHMAVYVEKQTNGRHTVVIGDNEFPDTVAMTNFSPPPAGTTVAVLQTGQTLLLLGGAEPDPLRLWYIGGDLTGSTGTAVPVWPSHKGYGPACGLPPDADLWAGPPTLYAGGLGGQTAVDRVWDGEDWATSHFAAGSQGYTDPITIYDEHGMTHFSVVDLYSGNDSFDVVCWFGNDGSGPYYFAQTDPNSAFCGLELLGRGDEDPQDYFASGTFTVTDYPQIIEIRLGGTEDTRNLHSFRVNGIDQHGLLGYSAAADDWVDWTQADIPGPIDVSIVQPGGEAVIRVYETIIYNKALEGTELDTVRSYLTGRYGLPT